MLKVFKSELAGPRAFLCVFRCLLACERRAILRSHVELGGSESDDMLGERCRRPRAA